MSNQQQQRVGLIVDAPHLYQSRELFGANIDYTSLYRKVSEYGEITHAQAHLRDIPGQQKFLAALASTGYTTYSRSGDSTSRRWIATIADSIMALAPHVGHLVVAVGDDRLAPILEFAESNWGCKITVLGFKKEDSDRDLYEFDYVELDATYTYHGRDIKAGN